MRLVLFDLPNERRFHFYPLVLNRPIWELGCGMTSLGEKLVAAVQPRSVACFVPDYLAESYRERVAWPVNDALCFSGDDLLLVNGRVKASDFSRNLVAPGEAVFDDAGDLLCAHVRSSDVTKSLSVSMESLIAWVRKSYSLARREVPVWNYVWELVTENPRILTDDFAAADRCGVEGSIEEPSALRGSADDVFVARDACIHPMVVIDAENGPVYIDEGAQVLPFTRIEGPCFIGKQTVLLAAKCRGGNSIGEGCRVGGEIEQTIMLGNSNKYHEGYLGRAYLGEWVNLGALTTNSDLRNDYANVAVSLDGRKPIDTGSIKMGSLIGDHAKTSIGTLFNTGAYVGAMTLIVGTGKPLPKHIPSFSWFLEGALTRGFGRSKLYETAETVMGRRGQAWTEAQRRMWDVVFEMTAPRRDEAIQRGRRTKSRDS